MLSSEQVRIFLPFLTQSFGPFCHVDLVSQKQLTFCDSTVIFCSRADSFRFFDMVNFAAQQEYSINTASVLL